MKRDLLPILLMLLTLISCSDKDEVEPALTEQTAKTEIIGAWAEETSHAIFYDESDNILHAANYTIPNINNTYIFSESTVGLISVWNGETFAYAPQPYRIGRWEGELALFIFDSDSTDTSVVYKIESIDSSKMVWKTDNSPTNYTVNYQTLPAARSVGRITFKRL
jgi:hypothetical protein